LKQDANKVIDIIISDYAKEVATLRKNNAILTEQNNRFAIEINNLKSEISRLKETEAENDEV